MGGCCTTCLQKTGNGVASCLVYDKPRQVKSEIKCCGWIYWTAWLGILIGYILVYTLLYKKKYQEIDTAFSATATNIHGIASAEVPYRPNYYQGNQVWDSHDLVVPSQENDEFFVMTNPLATLQQQRGECAEDPSYSPALCNEDADCVKGTHMRNGIATGLCVQAVGSQVKVCQIKAWCQVEDQTDFPMRNVLGSFNASYLQQCRYGASDPMDKYCPVFVLGDILKMAEQDYNEIAAVGGFILIHINWDCDLDRDVEECLPEYTFSRLDDPNSKISPGWSFRYTDYYKEGVHSKRDLTHAYGIRFIIKVTAKAGKFDIIRLGFAVGSGVGLLSLAGLVTCLCYCTVGSGCSCCCDGCNAPRWQNVTVKTRNESYFTADNCLLGAFQDTPAAAAPDRPGTATSGL